MMQATQTLPENYIEQARLDLSENQRAAVILNLVGAVLMVVFGALALLLANWLRQDLPPLAFSGSTWRLLLMLAGLLALLIVQVILHELIHGLFFWLYTGDRPTYGFKSLYAYAAAPDWYLPRNQHLITALAPLLLISLGGLLLLPVVPAGWLLALLVFVVANAAGAVGDMLAAVWLLRRPNHSLVQDSGDAISIFYPTG